MKPQTRTELIRHLSEAIAATASDNIDALETALAEVIRNKPVGSHAFTVWHFSDVQSEVPRLTDDQAHAVLAQAASNSGGINRDVFSTIADNLYPEDEYSDFTVVLDGELSLLITVPKGKYPADYTDFGGHVTDSSFHGRNNGTTDYLLPDELAKLQKFLSERNAK
jgi:hypothetical protein